MDEGIKKITTHVDSCSVCSAANQRVNDFCEEGKLLFYDYTKNHKPISIRSVILQQDQYDRLVEETRRARRSGENN